MSTDTFNSPDISRCTPPQLGPARPTWRGIEHLDVGRPYAADVGVERREPSGT